MMAILPQARRLVAAALLLLNGCSTVPRGITTVDDFELDRYLGRWYEIARLDHRFERGLSHVSAEYSKRADGGIKVVNRGFDTVRQRWREIEGRGYSRSEPGKGQLNVSFFWPFYGAYNIIALDKENYSYAVASGSSRSYFWILAREPQITSELKDELLELAGELGFPVEELIFVDHQTEIGIAGKD